MRGAAILVVLCAVAVTADQVPSRPATSAPVSGEPGAINAPPPTSSTKDPLNAVIRGRVIRADTGEPIEGAKVRTGLDGGFVVSDAEGRFELTKLRAGTYSLIASANGFPAIGSGSRGIGDYGRQITLTTGQIVTGVEFALQRGAVISGVVLDERGEPLPLAPVWLLRRQFVNGERRLVTVDTSDPASPRNFSITDDFGRFRLFGLRPGTYYLAGKQPEPGAAPNRIPGGFSLTSPALYPTGGSIAEAQPLTVVAGQELSGLSFPVRPIRTANIKGMLSSRTGPVAGEIAYTDFGGMAGTTRAGADGQFTLSLMPPGSYTFFVRDGDQVAFARIDLDGVDVILPLSMTRGGTVRGKVVTDPGESLAGAVPSEVTINASLLQPQKTVSATAKPDGTFELTGLLGPIHLTGRSTNGWFTKQVRVNGTDMTGLPIDSSSRNVIEVEVVLTRQLTMATGSVRDERGRAAADAYVILFAEDAEKRWPGTPYLRAARADGDGRFTIRGIPAGRYLAVAVDLLEPGEVNNPELVEKLESVATRVTMTNGVTQTLNLRVTPWP